MADCSIVILTYKGKHHLEFLLPTVKEAINNYRGNSKINVIVIDNGRDEITKGFVNTHFPEYEYVFSPVNDYLFSLNPFIAEIKDEFSFILNDDVKLDREVLNELIPIMEADSLLFSVACKIYDWDGNYVVSTVRVANYSKGWLESHFITDEGLRYSLYGGGGAAIFRTKFMNELGGFDELYRPAYCEDADLGIRAWQRSWKVICNSNAILYHREGGTIKDQFKKDKLEQKMYKNYILWMVKNVRMKGFLFWFFLLLPYRVLVNMGKNKNVSIALLKAMPKFATALKKRKGAKTLVADKDWLPLLNTTYKKVEI